LTAILVCGSCNGRKATPPAVDDLDQAASEVDTAAKAYRTSGLPWEAKDVRLGAPLPAEQNAAPLIRRAIKNLDTERYNAELPSIQSAISVGSYAKASSLVAGYDASLGLLIQASKLPGVDFQRDWDLGPAVLFSELYPMKLLGRLLDLRAEVECGNHDVPGAIGDLKAAWTLGDFAGSDPNLIGMLAQVAMQRAVLRSVQRCAFLVKDDPKALAQLLEVIDHGGEIDFAYAIRGQAYMGLCTSRNLKGFGGIKAFSSPLDSSPTKLDPKTLLRTGLPKDRDSRAFVARYLQSWTKVKLLADEYQDNPAQLQKSMARLGKQVESRRTASNMLNLMFFPTFTETSTIPVVLKADLVANRALLAALLMRARTGKIPASIRDIPGDWVDPFDGKPLRVRQTGPWFRVYSVGPNLKDDGGVFKTELKDRQSTAYDIGAAFEPEKPK
jgi:hypothetical protein